MHQRLPILIWWIKAKEPLVGRGRLLLIQAGIHFLSKREIERMNKREKEREKSEVGHSAPRAAHPTPRDTTAVRPRCVKQSSFVPIPSPTIIRKRKKSRTTLIQPNDKSLLPQPCLHRTKTLSPPHVSARETLKQEQGKEGRCSFSENGLQLTSSNPRR